jgi:thioredoxin reductase
MSCQCCRVSEHPYDCVVIGAGPAGLSASLFLARYRLRAVTFHFQSPRNVYSHGVHGFLGHHGIRPLDLLARGREEVEFHGGRIVDGCVTSAERTAGGLFRVTVGDGSAAGFEVEARRLVLATGLKDLTPDCPGFRDFYGEWVFHCPDCDGYEMTGKRVVALARGPDAAGFAVNLLTWTDRVTLVTTGDRGEVTAEHRARLAALGVPVVDKDVAGLEGDRAARRLDRVRFADGSTLECDALFFSLGTEPVSRLHEMLGCELDPDCGLVRVDETQQTSVDGVYAAGDLTPKSQLAVVAAAEGAMAAIHVRKSLIPPERRF